MKLIYIFGRNCKIEKKTKLNPQEKTERPFRQNSVSLLEKLLPDKGNGDFNEIKNVLHEN